MKDVDLFQSMGCIIKKERLVNYYPGYTCRYLVLESEVPYPGYYSMIDYKLEPRPLLLYLVVKNQKDYSEELVFRKASLIREQSGMKFDAAPAEITLFNRNYHAIRLNASNVAQVPEIVASFQSNDLQLHKHIEVKPYYSLIKIKRFFQIEKMESNLYHDCLYPENYYIFMNHSLPWETFEQIINHLRNNLTFSTFDAALGYIFTQDDIQDFMRVYLKRAKGEDLIQLRDFYLREISRI